MDAVSQSTPPRRDGQAEPRSTFSEDSSFNSSSAQGSIVHQSTPHNTSGSDLDSSFEALSLGTADRSTSDLSFEGIASSSGTNPSSVTQRSSPPAASPSNSVKQRSEGGEGGAASKERRHSRQPSLIAIDEKKELGLLNPTAQSFNPDHVSRALNQAFDEIVITGKDAYGSLTPTAKAALARLGLKTIPSLHGPLTLPYARCASGIDAFLDTADPQDVPWGDDEDVEGNGRPQRTLPLPLPGNARYTQAGRLALRYASAPAALGSSNTNRRFNRSPIPHRPVSNKLGSKPKRNQSSPQPPPSIEQDVSATLLAVQGSQAQQQAQAQQQQQLQADPQQLAQAQAALAAQQFFYQQAQLAQAFNGQATAAEMVASQASAAANIASQRAGLAANAALNSQSPPPPSSFSSPQPFVFPQSPYIDLSFLTSPPLVPQTNVAVQQQQQQQQTFSQPNDRLDPLASLKLAGQRQSNASTSQSSNTRSLNADFLVPTFDLQAPRGNSQAVDPDFKRGSISHAMGRGGAGGTGYDFLRRSTLHERRASPGHSEGEDTASLVKPPQVVRRRRSAAPAMPYPGHSLRKASTSSIVTVNRPAPVPQVRIFNDPTVVTTTSRRTSSVQISGPRALGDVVNSMHVSTSSLGHIKAPRTSPAETSSNWRRPSISTDDKSAGVAAVEEGEIVEPSPPAPRPFVGNVVIPGAKSRSRGGGGRKKGNRGSSRGRTTGSVVSQGQSSNTTA